jgi:hypothetical protein
MAMEMAVDIASIITSESCGVYRDMREDEATKYGAIAMMKIGSANVVKVLKVELCWKPVVVTSNKYLPPIEPLH